MQLPAQVNAALEIFRISIELDAWGVHMSCYGMSGVYSQIIFLMVWPILAICATPLIGCVLVLIFKQTTLRELWTLGRRRSPRGFIDAVLVGHSMPLSLLILVSGCRSNTITAHTTVS